METSREEEEEEMQEVEGELKQVVRPEGDLNFEKLKEFILAKCANSSSNVTNNSDGSSTSTSNSSDNLILGSDRAFGEDEVVWEVLSGGERQYEIQAGHPCYHFVNERESWLCDGAVNMLEWLKFVNRYEDAEEWRSIASNKNTNQSNSNSDSSNNNSTTTLLAQLPSGVLAAIFSKMDLLSLYKISQTSKWCHALANPLIKSWYKLPSYQPVKKMGIFIMTLV